MIGGQCTFELPDDGLSGDVRSRLGQSLRLPDRAGRSENHDGPGGGRRRRRPPVSTQWPFGNRPSGVDTQRMAHCGLGRVVCPAACHSAPRGAPHPWAAHWHRYGCCPGSACGGGGSHTSAWRRADFLLTSPPALWRDGCRGSHSARAGAGSDSTRLARKDKEDLVPHFFSALQQAVAWTLPLVASYWPHHSVWSKTLRFAAPVSPRWDR